MGNKVSHLQDKLKGKGGDKGDQRGNEGKGTHVKVVNAFPLQVLRGHQCGLRLDNLFVLVDLLPGDPFRPHRLATLRRLHRSKGATGIETFGLLLHRLLPQLSIDIAAYTAIGMRLALHVMPMFPGRPNPWLLDGSKQP